MIVNDNKKKETLLGLQPCLVFAQNETSPFQVE